MSDMINPFIEELIIDTSGEGLDIHEYIKNRKQYKQSGIYPTTYLEREDKISIYTKPAIRKKMAKLSGSATKLYVWIQQVVEYGSDSFQFNVKLFLEETGMSKSTLALARQELIDEKIIAKFESKAKFYWINPMFLFKGSRVKKYPGNLIIFKSNKEIASSNSKIQCK